MPHRPDFATFVSYAKGYTVVPVYRRLMADALTPVSAFKRIATGAEWAFLFESVVGGERIGRYSFLGAGPFLQIDAFDREVVITRDGQTERLTVDDPLQYLHDLLNQYRAPHLPELPRFVGGALPSVAVHQYPVVPPAAHDRGRTPQIRQIMARGPTPPDDRTAFVPE